MQAKNAQAILFVILAAAVLASACSTGEAVEASAFPVATSAPTMEPQTDQSLPHRSSAMLDPPTPLLFTASMMLASSVSAEPVSHADTELPRMRAALERAQVTARRAETMAALEARERIRLAERLEQLIEQTQRDQETIAQLEQALAERQEYIAAECQRFPNDRSDELP